MAENTLKMEYKLYLEAEDVSQSTIKWKQMYPMYMPSVTVWAR